MTTQETIARRIRSLCKERGITPNGLANLSAVPQATIKSILNGESQNPGTVTIKKNGLKKKKTYKVKVRVQAKGNVGYNASAPQVVTIKIKLK